MTYLGEPQGSLQELVSPGGLHRTVSESRWCTGPEPAAAVGGETPRDLRSQGAVGGQSMWEQAIGGGLEPP